MAKKKQKMVKISFEISEQDFDGMYEEIFTEVMNGYTDDGGDDGEEDYIEPQDLAKEYFEGYTKSDIIKEYLRWKQG